MLRLQSKSDIDKSKALARKQEIDEGLKLTRRIDTLREIVVQEEVALQKFRHETVAVISAEIKKLTEQKDGLSEEVSVLETRKKEALKPLDAAWKTLTVSQQEHKQSILSLEKEQKRYLADVNDLHGKEKTIDEELARIKQRKEQTEGELEKAATLRADADKDRADAEKIKSVAATLRDEVIAELRERDALLASRERDYTIKAEALEIEKERLRKAQIVLDDRNAMLERDITRFMKQKNESHSKDIK